MSLESYTILEVEPFLSLHFKAILKELTSTTTLQIVHVQQKEFTEAQAHLYLHHLWSSLKRDQFHERVQSILGHYDRFTLARTESNAKTKPTRHEINKSMLVVLAGSNAIAQLKELCGELQNATSSDQSLRPQSLPLRYSSNHFRPQNLPSHITGFYCSADEFAVRNQLQFFVNKGFPNRPKSLQPAVRNFVLIGPPASGKGTACALLTAAFPGLVHISSGALLRLEIAANEKNRNGRDNPDSLAAVSKRYTSKGQLVPDEIISKLVLKRIQQIDCRKHGFMLDGYPRNSTQCETLFATNSNPINIHYVILLEATRDVIIERSSGRRVDPKTGKNYHIKYSPPPTAEIFNRCIQRPDDRKEVVRARWDDYVATLPKILPWFLKTLKVDAENGDQWEVFHRIIDCILLENLAHFHHNEYDWTLCCNPQMQMQTTKSKL